MNETRVSLYKVGQHIRSSRAVLLCKRVNGKAEEKKKRETARVGGERSPTSTGYLIGWLLYEERDPQPPLVT